MPGRSLQQSSPSFLFRSTEALLIGGVLKSGPPLIPLQALERYGVLESATAIPAETVVFAIDIPFLPIAVTSADLLAEDNKGRLAEVLNQHTRLLLNLTKWRGMAFSLRYIFSPVQGEITITLLGRITSRIGDGRRVAEAVASDLSLQLQTLRFSVQPITSESELQARLFPEDRLAIAEIWQHRQFVTLTVEESFGVREIEAIVISPFRRPSHATWIEPFELIAAQSVPVVVNIQAEPVSLHWFEQERLEERTRIAQSAARYTLERNTYRRDVHDPVAATVGRLYADSWQRLSTGTPLAMTTQIASPDPVVAYSVAQSLARELTEVRPLDHAAFGEDLLPSGFDIITPLDSDDQEAAWRTMTEMEIHPLQASGVEFIGRLQYLFDVDTASAAFRFPVPLRTGLPGIRTRSVPRGWDRGPKQSHVPPGEIGLGEYLHRGGVVSIPKAAFNRHALVVGNTGSGKTTTCFHLLTQFWEQQVPFLVFEPVGREYRNLIASPIGRDLRIYTLGDDRTSPFRFNPLEVLPDVTVESHIGRVRACLEASMPTFGPLPSLIEEALHLVYMRKGWDLGDRPEEDDDRQMPMLGEFYLEIVRSIDRRGYTGEVLQNVRAATATRIASLLRGSKGRMLNTRRSLPLKDLLAWPTVLEMQQLNDEEKSLLILFLLTSIGEYLETTYRSSGLRHIVLIEEAHRVMGAPGMGQLDREISSATRTEAAGLLSTNLSEVRKWGQGLILAEQYASHLAADALANTNIKIVHDLRESKDLKAVADTIKLHPGKEADLQGLPPGHAAVFSDDFQQPSFFAVPNYRVVHSLPDRTIGADVRQHMEAMFDASKDLLPFDGCTWCEAPCVYRDRVGSIAYQLESIKQFGSGWEAFKEMYESGDTTGAWKALVKSCGRILEPMALDADVYAQYCLFSHLFTGTTKKDVAQAFLRTASGG